MRTILNQRTLTIGLFSMLLACGQAQTNKPPRIASDAARATSAPAGTRTPGVGESATFGPVEQFIQKSKKPVSWMTWGADLRLRNEYFNNSLTLGNERPMHAQDYFRFRGRVYTSISPITNLSLNVRVSAEPRVWMRPSYARVEGLTGQTDTEWRYGLIDNLYVQWKEIADSPFTLSVGRQDVLLGDTLNWWLFADGTPGDGSWSFFLDSARLTYEAKDIQTRFDAIYIYQNAEADEWLPIIRHQNPAPQLTEQTERGVVLYASNKSIKNTQIDGYLIYKGDDAQRAYGYNSDLYTLGSKITGSPAEHCRYSLEGAYQFGEKQRTDRFVAPLMERDVDAWGVNARTSYLLKDPMNNQFRFSVEYLSGDDPSTPDNESFDLLWGRWPRWSELYIYSYVPEVGRIAQIGNLIRFGPGWSLTPVPGLDFSAEYNALFADQEYSNPDGIAYPGSAGFGDGTFRGHYVQAILRYKLNQHVSAHLWGEFVWMGDFYAQRDLMSFLRAELYFTW